MVRIRLLLDRRRFPNVVGEGVQVLSAEAVFFRICFSFRDGQFD